MDVPSSICSIVHANNIIIIIMEIKNFVMVGMNTQQIDESHPPHPVFILGMASLPSMVYTSTRACLSTMSHFNSECMTLCVQLLCLFYSISKLRR